MDKVSLQLCSVNDYMIKDFKGTIKKVAQMGYTGVEFAGYGDLTSAALKELLKENKLEAVATHVSLDALISDADKEINFAREVGIPVIVCPYVYITTREEALKLASQLSTIEQKCRQAGIGLAYHNHAHEFIKADGEFLMDIVLNNVPGLICELDVFWVEYAGVNVLDYMKKLKDKLLLIHLKELSEAKTNVDFGKGIIDFPKIIELAKELGTKDFIVEQERYEVDSMVSAMNDLEYMKAYEKL